MPTDEILDARARKYVDALRPKWAALRLKAGLATVRQAAERTGVSKALIAIIEKPSQHVPTLETLVKLAWGYGVDPAEMASDTAPAGLFGHLEPEVLAWLADPGNERWVRRARRLAEMEKEEGPG